MRAGGSRAIYLPHVFPPAAERVTGKLFQYVPRNEVYMVRSGTAFAALVPELRRAVAEVDPRLPILNLASLDELVARSTAQERVTMRILLVSAGAALFLGIVGIYGVLAYAVRRRTAEIGIRVALGASPRRVTRMVVLHGAVLAGAGIVVGLGASLLLTRFMASLLYETSPTDPLTFAGTTALLLVVALAASWAPARRASRVDPAQALRAD
jgi:predicted lysophospholipase L1 biosynthesis ABC-type transport system permease subunit